MISSEVCWLYWSPISTGKNSIKELLEITLSPTKSILFMGLAKLCIEKNKETRQDEFNDFIFHDALPLVVKFLLIKVKC